MRTIYIIFAITFILMGYWLVIQQQDLDYTRLQLNRTLEKYAPVAKFETDYKEYTYICEDFQEYKVSVLSNRCTELGLSFESYYSGWPNEDYFIMCGFKEGKTQILRFRSS